VSKELVRTVLLRFSKKKARTYGHPQGMEDEITAFLETRDKWRKFVSISK
jgi:hypothetical protein